LIYSVLYNVNGTSSAVAERPRDDTYIAKLIKVTLSFFFLFLFSFFFHSFCLLVARWHVSPLRTSAEACLTGWPNALGHSTRSLKMVPLESLDTVSYSHSIAIMAVYLSVSTQYTNTTDRQTSHDGIGGACWIEIQAI